MKHWLYLVFLLAWALPIIGVQWMIGWRKLWRARAIWPWVVVVLGIYLTLADAVAIGQHIWFFQPLLLTGWAIGNIPVEEALFYFLTTTMIVQGFVMIFSRNVPHQQLARRTDKKKADLDRAS